MLQIILLLGLTGGQIQQSQATAQYQPCNWPNKCEQTELLSTITTCQWPKPCLQDGPISTCDFPHKCG